MDSTNIVLNHLRFGLKNENFGLDELQTKNVDSKDIALNKIIKNNSSRKEWI